jgi:pSer/pThr/pTyr-binding forkhead associated (FHA) protein
LDMITGSLEDRINDEKKALDRLEIMNGPEDGRIFEINKPDMLIGRAEESDVFLGLDLFITRRHARLIAENGQYYILDLGGLNGTLLNNLQITGKTDIKNGDMLSLGETKLKLKLKEKQP